MQAPTSERFRLMQKFYRSFKISSYGASIARPPLPQLQTKKYFPAPLAGLQCRPLQAKGKACVKILSLFQNFIVGASIACPPLPQLPAPKYTPAPLAGLPCRPLQAKDSALRKIISLFRNFIVGASIARPLKPCGITRPPGGAEPHPYHKPRESAFEFYRHFAIFP